MCHWTPQVYLPSAKWHLNQLKGLSRGTNVTNRHTTLNYGGQTGHTTESVRIGGITCAARTWGPMTHCVRWRSLTLNGRGDLELNHPQPKHATANCSLYLQIPHVHWTLCSLHITPLPRSQYYTFDWCDWLCSLILRRLYNYTITSNVET